MRSTVGIPLKQIVHVENYVEMWIVWNKITIQDIVLYTIKLSKIAV